MRKIIMLGLMAFCSIIATVPPSSAQGTNTAWFGGDLKDSHGNHYVRGRHNTVHLVFARQDGAMVYHRGGLSQSGAFSFPWPTISQEQGIVVEGGRAMFPCVDEDYQGSLGVAFINARNGEYGDLVYAYRNTVTNSTWSLEIIAENVTRPAIAISQGIAHLAWQDDENRIRYGSFNAAAPSFLGLTAEFAAVSNCPFSGYTKPAITLKRDTCKPDIVTIAAIFFSDEYSTSQLTCGYASTQIGPVVRERDNHTQTWQTTYQDFQMAGSLNNPYRAVSLSLGGNYNSGVTYLAYADEVANQGRTMLAVGQQSQWQTQAQFLNDAQPIHIVANEYGNTADFGVIWEGNNTSIDTAYRTGKWLPHQNAISWVEPEKRVGSSSLFVRPQAIFWKYCRQQTYNLHWISELNLSPSYMLWHDYSLDISCGTVSYARSTACLDDQSTYRAQVRGSSNMISVDVGSFGFVSEWMDDAITLSDGHHRYSVTWQEGRLDGTWETGFRLIGTDRFTIESSPEAPSIVMDEEVTAPLPKFKGSLDLLKKGNK